MSTSDSVFHGKTNRVLKGEYGDSNSCKKQKAQCTLRKWKYKKVSKRFAHGFSHIGFGHYFLSFITNVQCVIFMQELFLRNVSKMW